MKKLTFALFVAFGATLFASCGPKIDTPENLGKSLIEALSSQDQEAYAKLVITKEEMLSLIDEAAKTQLDESAKMGLEEMKTDVQGSFDEKVAKAIKETYDSINKDAKKENINWEEVEFVSAEITETKDPFNFKAVDININFKTETATNLHLNIDALQVEGEWKIVDMDGLEVY